MHEFVLAYNVFSQVYSDLFPRSRSDELMTPKIAYIEHEVVRWIKKFELSLLIITEQAFEAVHYKFVEKEKTYSIPRTGEELLAGQRRFTSDPAFGRKRRGTIEETSAVPRKRAPKTSQPSSSSAATTEATQRGMFDSSSEDTDDDHTVANSDDDDDPSKAMQKKQRARELLRDAVAAFNTQNLLNCGTGCYERMRTVNSFLASHGDRRHAPWKPRPAKRKRRKSRRYEDDEDWEM